MRLKLLPWIAMIILLCTSVFSITEQLTLIYNNTDGNTDNWVNADSGITISTDSNRIKFLWTNKNREARMVIPDWEYNTLYKINMTVDIDQSWAHLAFIDNMGFYTAGPGAGQNYKVLNGSGSIDTGHAPVNNDVFYISSYLNSTTEGVTCNQNGTWYDTSSSTLLMDKTGMDGCYAYNSYAGPNNGSLNLHTIYDGSYIVYWYDIFIWEVEYVNPMIFTGNWTNTSEPIVDDDVRINETISDDDGVSGYIFSFYNYTSSAWQNDTWATASGETVYNASVVKTMNDDTYYNWTWFANDTSDLWTQSDYYYLNVIEQTPPSNSTWNVTSTDLYSTTQNTTTWIDAGTINVTENELSFTFNASENSNWSCGLRGLNYNEMLGQNYFCYQEFANVSTNCANISTGLDTGNYSLTGTWSSVGAEDPSYSTDGDWGTYSVSTSSNSGQVYMNYTKPTISGLQGAVWQVGDDGATPVRTNITLPNTCFSQSDTIRLYAESELIGDSSVTWHCYNGTAWQLLRTDVADNRVYEEAIFWNFSYGDSNNKLATTETKSHAGTLYDNLSSGTQCMYCSGIDAAGNEPLSRTSSSGCLSVQYNESPTWIINISDTILYFNNTETTYLTNLTDYINDVEGDTVSFSVQLENTSEVDCEVWGTQSLNLTPAAEWTGSANCTIGVNDSWHPNGGRNNTFGITVSVSNTSVILYLDGVSTDRMYEQGTYTNVTANFTETCYSPSCLITVNITDDINNSYSIIGSDIVSFFYNTSKIRLITFNDSTTAVNVTGNGTVEIDLDAKAIIDSFLINVSGFNVTTIYPTDVKLDYDGNFSDYEDILIGQLIGTDLYGSTFIFSGTEYTLLNLTRGDSGRTLIYMNMSTLTTDKVINFSIQLDGFDVDKGNNLDFVENWSTNLTDANISTHIRAGIFDYYDNMEDVNAQNYWTFDYSEGTGDKRQCNETKGLSDNYLFLDLPGRYYHNNGLDGHTSICRMDNTNDAGFELQNLDRLFVRGFYSKQAYKYFVEGLGCYSNADFIITDGTTDVTAYGIHSGAQQSPTIQRYFNISMDKISGTSWSVNYKDDADQDDTQIISLTSLNTSKDWYVEFVVSQSAQALSVGRVCSMENWMKIYDIKANGFRINRSGFNLSEYQGTNASITSNVFARGDNVYNGLYLFANFSEPTGTDITYEISVDNGTTWEDATSSVNIERYVVTGTGKNLSYRINLTTNDLNVTPWLYYFNIQVIPGAASNISIDVGNDDTVDWSYDDILNTTNSPQTFICDGNCTAIQNYVNLNCETDAIACVIPVSVFFGSAGTIQFSDFNITTNPSPINITPSIVESFNPINITFNYTNGILQTDDLRIDYFGSKNVTVLAYKTTNTSENDTQLIKIKYSNFNISLPFGYDYYDVRMKSTDIGVSPDGQTSSIPIWNVTSGAYDGSFNLYTWLNESIDSCLEIYWFNNSDDTGDSTYCYQETANVSSGCGGKATGSYSVTNNVTYGIFDINYTKPEFLGGGVGFWRVKHGGDSDATDSNLTLTDACFYDDTDKVILRIISEFGTPSSTAKCYNGTSWHVLSTKSGDSTVQPPTELNNPGYLLDGIWTNSVTWIPPATSSWDRRGEGPSSSIWEEAMYWQISSEITTTPKRFINNVSIDGTVGIWNYITSTSCGAGAEIPYFNFATICDGCIVTDDWYNQVRVLTE